MTNSSLMSSSPEPQLPAVPLPAIPREIKVLVAAAFLIAVGFGMVAPVLPQFAKSFDLGVGAAAIVVSVFAFTRLIFAPASGILVEKLGERQTYVAGILIVAASSAACAFAQDYWQLLIFRGLGGIGSTMFTVSAMGLIVRLAPADARGRVSSLYAGSFLLGNIAGPVIGGLLAGFGMALPFFVYAGALVIVAILVGTLLPNVHVGKRGNSTNAEVLTFSTALKLPAFRAALASSFANGWSAMGIRMALVPLFATAVLGAGPEVAGVSLAVFAIGTAIALTFAGKLADSWGRRPMILIGLAVNGIAMGVLGFTTTEFAFFAVSLVAGVGSGIMGPAQQASVADIIGSKRSGGKVLAGFQMSSDLGGIIGPIFAGYLVDLTSYGVAFSMASVVCLLAFCLWMVARETKPVQQQN